MAPASRGPRLGSHRCALACVLLVAVAAAEEVNYRGVDLFSEARGELRGIYIALETAMMDLKLAPLHTAFLGAHATMSVHQPFVHVNVMEFSAACVQLSDATSLLEIGWMVNPGRYGDQRPHLYVYYTNSSRQEEGHVDCYDLDCGLFAPSSRLVRVGQALSTLSTTSGQLGQAMLVASISKDKKSGTWRARVGRDTVGHWPASTFGGRPASFASFGGQVVNSWPLGMHTRTAMGSGVRPNRPTGPVGRFEKIMYTDQDGKEHDAATALAETTLMRPCYDLKHEWEPINKEHSKGARQPLSSFMYGGGGFAVDCP
eukprot:SM000148S01000  [mRNA]  locus=s148:66253:67993:+ [translate_table: standard]